MKNATKVPTNAEWKQLYDLAAELKKLEPWEWMEEIELFGVENPDTKETGFVSVMGTLGDHKAIGIYLGTEALYKFWDFQDDEKPEPESLALFDLQQIQVSFESRSTLEKQDLDIIKKLGLKFRGSQSYPMFRSIKPGYLPWFISSEEARFLICAIEQTLEVAPRVRKDPLILIAEDDPKEEIYLVRVAEEKGTKLIWRDEWKRVEPPTTKKVSISIPSDIVEKLKGFPQDKKMIFEMDLFSLPMPIGRKGERPILPKMLMVTDRSSLFILGAEFLEPREDVTEMNAVVADSLFKILSSHKILPGEINVGSDLLFELLKTFNQRLNVRLRQTTNLYAIKEAKNALIQQFFGNRF